MRILYVTQVVLDRPHGGARHVLAVARRLAHQGNAVELLAPGREDDVAIEGYRRLRPWSGLEPGVRMEAALATVTGAAALRFSPHAAYIRLSASSSFVPFTLAALQIPFVVELNGRLLDELRNLGRSPAAIATVRFNLRRVVRRAEAVVAVEPKIGRHAREALGARRVVVIENGADTDVATPGSREAARRALDLPFDRPIVAFAGTLVPELRLDLLFEVAKRAPELVFVLAGDGPQRSRVEDACRAMEDRIRWLGPVPHGRALELLRAADVCVNVREGDLGMKSLEYASVGRRFVNFDVEGVERLTALYPGFDAVHIVKQANADALESAISAALRAERERGPLPPEAVEAVRHRVGWEHTTRRIADLLREISNVDA